MSEIAKCPVCGKEPISSYYPHQEKIVVSHCDVQMPDSLWNKYAAAMDLATVRADYANVNNSYSDEEVHEMWDDVTNATKRVLEVWNG